MPYCCLLPAGLSVSYKSDVPFYEVPVDTLMFAQSIPSAQPAWFVTAQCACAFAMRFQSSVPRVPRVFSTTRPLVMVDVMRVDVLSKLLRHIEDEIAAAQPPPFDPNSDDMTPSQRAHVRLLRYTAKRLGKLKSGVLVATGFGADAKSQERALQAVQNDPGARLRDGFQKEGGSAAEDPNVSIGDVVFGNDPDSINRVALVKYEHAFCLACKRAFPWADGYACGVTASTWHADQMYPSEMCLFAPATALSDEGELPAYPEVKSAIEQQTTLTPIVLPDVDSFMVRFDLLAPQRGEDVPQSQSGGGTPIAIDIEDVVSCLDLDNPLLNNEVDEKDVTYDLFNICPPVKRKR
jgi:hypothetical protein